MGKCVLVTATLVCSLVAATRLFSVSEPPQDPHRGWVDYDDLDQVERLKERPGNYHVLATVADFFDGIYQIRPAFKSCTYPLQLTGVVIERAEDIEKGLNEQAKGGGRKNKLRQFNIQVRSLSVHDAEGFDKSAEFKKLHESDRKRFGEVRKRHPGRAVVVLVQADLESLQSPKVEGGEVPNIFYLVWQKGRWLVAWYEKP